MKFFKHNDIFAGIIMAIVFTAVIALLGIGGSYVYKSTPYGRSQIRIHKAQTYLIHNYKHLKLCKK